VGFLVQGEDRLGNRVRLLYTSDFMDLPRVPDEIRQPDYLIIQSFWLNEPIQNRPHHMSFQRAIHFIERLKPRRETFLVHLGDADMVPGDPANRNAKKYEPREALSPGPGESPYPIPLNQEQWQDTVDRIAMDRGLPYIITVAYDDLQVSI
jgi:phosphoribosyl 1,2-cyclic phosphate phosphodiesterase